MRRRRRKVIPSIFDVASNDSAANVREISEVHMPLSEGIFISASTAGDNDLPANVKEVTGMHMPSNEGIFISANTDDSEIIIIKDEKNTS